MNFESATGAAENSGKQTMSDPMLPACSTSANALGRALIAGEYSTEQDATRTFRDMTTHLFDPPVIRNVFVSGDRSTFTIGFPLRTKTATGFPSYSTPFVPVGNS